MVDRRKAILQSLFQDRIVGGSLPELASYADLFFRTPDGVLLTDPASQTVLDANPAAGKLFGVPAIELVGQTLLELSIPGRGNAIEARIKGGVEVKIDRSLMRIQDYFEVEQVLIRDLTEVKKAEAALHEANQKLHALSLTDVLTGLPNRRALEEKLDAELRSALNSGAHLSIAFVDIDHFKKINDTHGHAGGDRVLIQVARILQETLARDGFVGRYGGEEFVCVLPGMNSKTAGYALELCRKSLEESRIPEGATQPLGNLTASFGLATCPLDGKTLDGLLHVADALLYDAKSLGRNQVATSDIAKKLKKVA
jgi:diguanylate cyclase (GGDEF)-like protein